MGPFPENYFGLRTCCSCNCFPKFLKFWTLLLTIILPKIVWIHELCFCFPCATSLDCFEVNYFHAFQKIACVYNCFGLWNLKFYLKMLSFDLNDFFQCYRKCISVRIKFIVLYEATVLETVLFILPTLRRSLFFFCRSIVLKFPIVEVFIGLRKP